VVKVTERASALQRLPDPLPPRSGIVSLAQAFIVFEKMLHPRSGSSSAAAAAIEPSPAF